MTNSWNYFKQVRGNLIWKYNIDSYRAWKISGCIKTLFLFLETPEFVNASRIMNSEKFLRAKEILQNPQNEEILSLAYKLNEKKIFKSYQIINSENKEDKFDSLVIHKAQMRLNALNFLDSILLYYSPEIEEAKKKFKVLEEIENKILRNILKMKNSRKLATYQMIFTFEELKKINEIVNLYQDNKKEIPEEEKCLFKFLETYLMLKTPR